MRHLILARGAPPQRKKEPRQRCRGCLGALAGRARRYSNRATGIARTGETRVPGTVLVGRNHLLQFDRLHMRLVRRGWR